MMQVQRATKDDCRAIAELALMAGEGIPAFFWEQSRKAGQGILDVGAQSAACETENFSYRNVTLALVESQIAGMLLAYRLPDAGAADSPENYPEFIRPLIELEQCVPGSFYINMLATYPRYRSRGVGGTLMRCADGLALEAGCKTLSLEVFEENEGALRLYQRLGFAVAGHRPVIPHSCHPHKGRILLLTRDVAPV